MPVRFSVDGCAVEVDDDGLSLLDVLRDRLGLRSVKDGCSPQGQCGCCTVLVDGAPRVACVTPARRVAGRTVTTVEGLDPAVRDRWAAAFTATGASQCGFCTPGILLRLVAEAAKPVPRPEQALLAHLCRCTGWRPILDAFEVAVAAPAPISAAAGRTSAADPAGRDLTRAARRAELEGGTPQRVGPDVALGRGGFADDGAPAGALVAVLDEAGELAVGDGLAEARRTAGKVQGRRTTVAAAAPVAVPGGSWDVVLQTSWVDPGYVETDASWCEPGGTPAHPLANGGAFGGKVASPVAALARAAADRHGRVVRVLWSREDVVRAAPKRPPLAAGIHRAAGRVVVHVARTPGIVERLRLGLGADELAARGVQVVVEEVDVAGPPTSVDLRAAGWAEGVALRTALLAGDGAASGAAGTGGGPTPAAVAVAVRQPHGGLARVAVLPSGAIEVQVEPGNPLDAVVLRSYCTGAVHMALSWVTAERLAVGPDGVPQDLTVRSLGVLRAVDMPPLAVRVDGADGAEPVAVSDAVFAATAAAAWQAQGWPPSWPTGRPLR